MEEAWPLVLLMASWWLWDEQLPIQTHGPWFLIPPQAEHVAKWQKAEAHREVLERSAMHRLTWGMLPPLVFLEEIMKN